MVENNKKPRVFVGCSVESLDIGYCIQEELEYDVDVTLWKQGVMAPSGFTLDDLTASLGIFDFAVFVATPDDKVRSRGSESFAVRDNVLFELGLFVGHLGRSRCFLVAPRAPTVTLPSDLAGLSPLTFDASRSDDNLQAALGPACSRIRRAIKTQGVFTISQHSRSAEIGPSRGVTKEQRIQIETTLQTLMANKPIQPCLLFIDIDGFTAVNKWYGEGVCDEVVAVIEDTISKSFSGQYFTRIGGDQFLICPTTGALPDAVKIAERLVETVCHRPWNWISPNLFITVSVGVAQAKPGEEIGHWIVRAIHGAVNAKREGGGRVKEGPIALSQKMSNHYTEMLS